MFLLNRCWWTAVVGLVALAGTSPAQTFTIDLDDISLYAGGTLSLPGFASVEGGAVVAVGDVTGSLDVDSIYGEGSLLTNGFDDSRGPIYFNGSIDGAATLGGIGGPGSVLGGPVTSATGDLTIGGSTTVNGNVTAAGKVAQTFGGIFNGSVSAGGDVTIEGDVNGNITHGGSFTPGTSATVSGTVTPGGPVAPLLFDAPEIAPGRGLAAGSNDVNLSFAQDIALVPGTYGSLNFDSGNTVRLTAGEYVFADIVSTFSLNELSFDTTGGDISIYVAAPDFSLDLIQSINGVTVRGARRPNPTQADNITFEVAGSLELISDFYGTVLVPEGDLELATFAELTGRALAGGNVVLGDSAAILAVPEPTSAAAVLAGLGLVGLRRR